jgi:hypothetical protein
MPPGGTSRATRWRCSTGDASRATGCHVYIGGASCAVGELVIVGDVACIARWWDPVLGGTSSGVRVGLSRMLRLWWR